MDSTPKIHIPARELTAVPVDDEIWEQWFENDNVTRIEILWSELDELKKLTTDTIYTQYKSDFEFALSPELVKAIIRDYVLLYDDGEDKIMITSFDDHTYPLDWPLKYPGVPAYESQWFSITPLGQQLLDESDLGA